MVIVNLHSSVDLPVGDILPDICLCLCNLGLGRVSRHAYQAQVNPARGNLGSTIRMNMHSFYNQPSQKEKV